MPLPPTPIFRVHRAFVRSLGWEVIAGNAATKQFALLPVTAPGHPEGIKARS